MNLTREKQKNFILYFLEKNGGKIERLELMKFIWMSDRIHLNKYGRTISKDNYCALPYGPVPSTILDLSKISEKDFLTVNKFDIKSHTKFNEDFFSKSDLTVMDYVWDKFNALGSINFSDYSHTFPEWLRFKKPLEDPSSPNMYKIVMDDFFEFPDLERFGELLNTEDIESSKNYYNAHSSFQDFLNS